MRAKVLNGTLHVGPVLPWRRSARHVEKPAADVTAWQRLPAFHAGTEATEDGGFELAVPG